MSLKIDFIAIDELTNRVEEIAATLEAVARGEGDVSPRVVNFLGYQLGDVAKAMRDMVDNRSVAEARP